MSLELRFAALSDVGRVRQDNQDSGYAGPHLLAVADGVGGAARGDIASTTAIQQLRGLDQAPGNDALETLAGSIHLAHNRLADLVADDPELDGTSTTTTAMIFDGTGVNVAHVGDSRAYLLRDGELRPLTKDHTFVQSLVDDGRISEDEAKVHPHRNLILRAVDGVHEPDPDLSRVEVQAGDRLLLCSDGCCGTLSDADMAELLAGEDIAYVPGALVAAALDAGSTDNVTVVAAEVVEATDGAEAVGTALTVGAAAGEGRPTTSTIKTRPTDAAVEDPEALRYAPLPPRRFTWLRRSAAVVIVLALIAAVLYGGYRWTQTRYYVGVSADKVAIYQGVNWNLPVVDLDEVHRVTALPVSVLNQSTRSNLDDGIPVTSRTAAEHKVDALIDDFCTQRAAQKRAEAAKKKREQQAREKRSRKKGTTTKRSTGSNTTTTTPPSPLDQLCEAR